MTIRKLVAPANKRSDGSRRCIKYCDAKFFNQFPKTIRLRPVRSPSIHQDCRTDAQRSIDDVAVAGYPTNVRRAKINILLLQIEDVLCRDGRTEQIPGCGVQYPLRLSGRAARIEDKKR